MVRFHSAATTLASLALFQNASVSSAIDRSTNCEPIEKLGSSDLDRYNYSTSIDIDNGCSYSLEIKIKHDASLPIPFDGIQCDPSIIPPAIDSDGLPYFANRWAYESVPKHIQKATGIDHISVDFNPCGHPPLGVFSIPHYNLHIYLVDPEYRSCMTCQTIPGFATQQVRGIPPMAEVSNVSFSLINNK